MPRNGSGTYSLPAGNPVVTGTVISSTVQNNTTSDIATALTNSIAKDGQTTPTANLPMGGFKLTGLAAGSAATDSANLTQIQAQAYLQLGTVAGTDTITATTNPVTASYVLGQTYRFIAAATNTTAVTLNINGLGAKAVTKKGSTALVAGDILINALYQVTYDGTRFQLENPSVTTLADDSVTASTLADSALGFSMTNGTIVATVAASALTIAIKTKAGTDPSSTDPVLVYFRSSTLTSGVYNVRSVTAATSIVVSSGSTLGTTSAVASQIDVLLLDNAGTVELAVVNHAGGLSLPETDLITTVAEGGAGAADSINVIYSTTLRASVPYRNAGYVVSTQATAGTWATNPSQIQLTAVPQPRGVLVSGTAVASTSGTSFDYTGIPSWVKRVTLMLNGVSTSSTSFLRLRIGPVGGVETSGYLGTAGTTASAAVNSQNFTAGFDFIESASGNAVRSGAVTLTLLDSSTNTWVIQGAIGQSDSVRINYIAGVKPLAGALSIVRFTTVNGTDTFDAGSVNIMYE